MSKVLIMGHGNYASGSKSVIDLVVGGSDSLLIADFTQDKSSDTYKEEVENLLKNLDEYEVVYCFTDILGGTPFKVACELKSEGKNIEVFAGANIPMLIEIIISQNCGLDVDIQNILNIGKSSIFYYDVEELSKMVEISEKEGI